MDEPITREIFDHLVGLAALQLTETEAEYLRRQLNNQINAIHELEAIPLDVDVPVSSHGVAYTQAIRPAIRDDAWDPFPNADDILAQAPHVEDRYIIVPDIPHTDLS